MSVDDKIVAKYEADVSQYQRQLEQLRASQNAFAAEVVKGLESQNKQLEQTISKWAGIAAGIAGAVASIKFAASAWHAYVERANAEAATYGVSLEKLRAASAGLKTDTELLNFAEKAQTRDLALTRNEMELVLKAQVALARNGRELSEVEEAVGSALTKNSVKPLKDIGILLRQNEDPAKNFTQIMKALANAASDAGAAEAEVGENVQRAGVAIENSWTNLKVAAGKLIDEGLSPLTSWLTDALGWLNDFLSEAGSPNLGKDLERWGRQRVAGTVGDAVNNASAFGRFQDSIGEAMFKATIENTLRNMAGIQKDTLALASRSAALARTRKPGPAGDGGQALLALSRWDEDTGRFYDDSPTAIGGGFTSSLAGTDWARAASEAGDLTTTREGYAKFNSRNATSKLEQMFGPIEDFNIYKEAFGMLSGAVTTALDAWITGSESAGKAVKRFIAEVLRAEASKMAVLALENGAQAAYHAALYDYPGAAKFTASAALFTAGAAAAAGAARALGGGGGGGAPPAGGAGAAPATPASAGSGGDGVQRPVVIVYGDAFAQQTDRQRAIEARRLVSAGMAQAQGRGVAFK